MLVKECHKPPMNGKHTTFKNGDDWGLVYYCLTHIIFYRVRAIYIYIHMWKYIDIDMRVTYVRACLCACVCFDFCPGPFQISCPPGAFRSCTLHAHASVP